MKTSSLEIKTYQKLPPRRCRKFVDGVDKESDRFSREYPDFVEVPMHILKDGAMILNPDYESADFEQGFIFSDALPS